jgi:hypothetical protein
LPKKSEAPFFAVCCQHAFLCLANTLSKKVKNFAVCFLPV